MVFVIEDFILTIPVHIHVRTIKNIQAILTIVLDHVVLKLVDGAAIHLHPFQAILTHGIVDEFRRRGPIPKVDANIVVVLDRRMANCSNGLSGVDAPLVS